jgi:hypothetical protein
LDARHIADSGTKAGHRAFATTSAMIGGGAGQSMTSG